MTLLEPHDIEQRCSELPGWSYNGEDIRKTYTLPTFHRAIGFVVEIAMLADALDHHPDIDIRYNRVSVTLSTHSAGGVTDKDFVLALRIETAHE